MNMIETIREYKFTWCEYLTPCKHHHDIMIGSKECLEDCIHSTHNKILQDIDTSDISYSAYPNIGEGYIICSHPTKE